MRCHPQNPIGMMANIGMMSTMRCVVTMMKAKDSIQNLTLHDLMNFWIGLIWWSMSLGITTPLDSKR